ncbi:MAG: hypothetical protein RJA87_2256 [Pseudomonadota bacterium]|jgi:hypothetical protein
MDNSVSNIQLTPEAKRMIEGEIAYQTSGRGFWIGVVFGYVFLGMFAIGILVVTISETFFGSKTQWFGLLMGLWVLIPAWGIAGINRSIKYRKGPAQEQKTP